MKRTALARLGVCVLSATILTTACLNSEEEYRGLTEQVEGLSAEMETARREQEILNRALENITQERDRLQAALLPYEPAPSAGAAAPGGASTPDGTEAGAQQAGGGEAGGEAVPAAGAVHVAQRGDILSNIASRYNTTIQELLALNPYLARREGYMVWENDAIQLPAGASSARPEVPAGIF